MPRRGSDDTAKGVVDERVHDDGREPKEGGGRRGGLGTTSSNDGRGVHSDRGRRQTADSSGRRHAVVQGGHRANGRGRCDGPAANVRRERGRQADVQARRLFCRSAAADVRRGTANTTDTAVTAARTDGGADHTHHTDGRGRQGVRGARARHADGHWRRLPRAGQSHHSDRRWSFGSRGRRRGHANGRDGRGGRGRADRGKAGHYRCPPTGGHHHRPPEQFVPSLHNCVARCHFQDTSPEAAPAADFDATRHTGAQPQIVHQTGHVH